MTATDPTEEQTARRPMSFAGAADIGSCEERLAVWCLNLVSSPHINRAYGIFVRLA
ncbi:hypothetical protein EDD53_1737 [Pacificibacter maritimus]|uniref:Uncharacterized protein n=1 Tax=Pacificibacter maritimus TaxID=762213 RepID=A0A3N4UJ22_9RHOB|nr:hypothetical protein EDD53_1737 [Pacificibacter maritimus]